MDTSSIEKLLENIIKSSDIENSSEEEIINKISKNPDFIKIISDKNNPILKEILKQYNLLFNDLNKENNIIESNFCFFGKTDDKNKLILSLKVPQLFVDKYILMDIIKELLTTIDYLESQEKNK